jgi:hypothetical protein
MHHRRTSIALAPMALLAVVGCNDHPLKPICYQSWGETTSQVSLDSRRKVDILFVIDDSGSMGEEQGALAANFSALVEQLESFEVGADYRIGITTTDSAHPFCPDPQAQLGALQLRSCLSHLDDFVFGDDDRRDEACRSRCPAELEGLAPLPTALEDGGPLAPRPWLERSDRSTNVPDGVTTAQALACWGPQGIDGCGYEAPLEAVLAAFARSEDDDDPAAGFLRDDALLQVVIVTDEVDCSIAPGGEAAFDPEGSRTLWWTAPTARSAPSAVCWRAGTACQTLPDGRTECLPADIDAEGQPATPEDAVLHPVSRYMEALRELDERKRAHMRVDEPQVLLSVIAGVPQGWDGSPIDYSQGDDGGFASNFGVGAGCRSEMGQAVPPVRLLAVADEFGEANVFSICDGDYRPALEAIAGRLVEQLSRPTCIAAGYAVVDGEVEGCYVQQRVGDELRSVPRCERDGDAWVLGAGQTLCSHAVSGEDVHPSCAADDSDVEVKYLYAPGVAFGEVEVICEVEPGGRCGPAME